ncbi:MAG: PadR family transcriptional regulator [Micromonosporaceae bacterium]
MAKRREVNNPLALAVLAFLRERPMHPYELGRLLKERGNDRNIKFNHSSLYMVVDQLLRAGFIQAQETVRDTPRPERTVYALTDAGTDEMHDWMRDLVSVPREEYPHFGVALSLLGVLAPTQAADLLAVRQATLHEQVDEVRSLIRTALDGGLHPIFLVEEEYRRALLEAELGFVNNLLTSIKDPEYVRPWREFHEEKP